MHWSFLGAFPKAAAVPGKELLYVKTMDQYPKTESIGSIAPKSWTLHAYTLLLWDTVPFFLALWRSRCIGDPRTTKSMNIVSSTSTTPQRHAVNYCLGWLLSFRPTCWLLSFKPIYWLLFFRPTYWLLFLDPGAGAEARSVRGLAGPGPRDRRLGRAEAAGRQPGSRAPCGALELREPKMAEVT